jgi:hypothetical protein
MAWNGSIFSPHDLAQTCKSLLLHAGNQGECHGFKPSVAWQAFMAALFIRRIKDMAGKIPLFSLGYFQNSSLD